MNGSDLRKIFLDNAQDIVVSMTNSAKGADDPVRENPDIDTASYMNVWNLASDIIKNSSDIVKIEARTTEGIVKAVCEGKMTVKEAKELMELFQTKQNIDELPKLLEALGKEND